MRNDDDLTLLAYLPMYRMEVQHIFEALNAGAITNEQALKERQKLFGICSDPDCEFPIAGYYGYGPKLCVYHLSRYGEKLADRTLLCQKCGQPAIDLRLQTYGFLWLKMRLVCSDCYADEQKVSGGDGAR